MNIEELQSILEQHGKHTRINGNTVEIMDKNYLNVYDTVAPNEGEFVDTDHYEKINIYHWLGY